MSKVLNDCFVQGYTVLAYRSLTQEILQTHVEVSQGTTAKVKVSAKDWIALLQTLSVVDRKNELVALVISPSGKVLLSSASVTEAEKGAQRFERYLAWTAIEEEDSDGTAHPNRITADEWVTKRLKAGNTETQKNVQEATKKAATPSKGNLRTKSSEDRKVSEVTKTEPQMTTCRKTKVSVRCSSRQKNHVIEVNDTAKLKFSEFVATLPFKADTFILSYPRKEFSLSEHGEKNFGRARLEFEPISYSKRK